MAPRWSFVLGTALLSGRYAVAEDYEVFPLSGGIDNGVTVTISVAGLDFPSAKIQFLKPNREEAFGLHYAETKITRSWALQNGDNTGSLEYGSFPAELTANGEATLEFTKRRNKWAVSIAGKRFPWFDFMHQHAETDLLTHVRVYSGMKDAEVTLERKTCSTACHPDECTNYNDTVQFYVSGPSGECTQEKETQPDASEHCCDGEEAVVESTTGLVGKFALIHDSQSNVDRVCDALATADCGTGFAGKVVQVLKVNDNDGTVDVFIPFAQASKLEGPDYKQNENTYPVFAVKPKTKVAEKLFNFKVGGPSGENPFRGTPPGTLADGHNSVVFASDSDLQKGWYVNMVRLMVRNNDDAKTPIYRWIAYSKFAGVQIGGANNDDLWLLAKDEDVEPSQCEDVESWMDVRDATCANYTAGNWCDRHGALTDEGKAEFGDSSVPKGSDGFPNAKAPIAPYIRGNFECCQCGGGRHVEPAGGPGNTPSTEMNQMLLQ